MLWSKRRLCGNGLCECFKNDSMYVYDVLDVCDQAVVDFKEGLLYAEPAPSIAM